MRGDIIIVEEHHRSAGHAIAERLASEIRGRDRRTTITVAQKKGRVKSHLIPRVKRERRRRWKRGGMVVLSD